MNYRVTDETTIVKTGAAVDGTVVFGTLIEAKTQAANQINTIIAGWQAARKSVKGLRERELAEEAAVTVVEARAAGE